MRRWVRNSTLGILSIVGIGLLLIAAANTVVLWDGSPNVEVTMRLLDAETGEPLDDATVSVVVHRSALEDPDFADQVQHSLDHQDPEDPDGPVGLRVHSQRANEQQELTIYSIAITAGKDVLGMTVRSERHLPSLVVIDHDRYGRTIVPIPADQPVREGGDPFTYAIDIGTIRIPRARCSTASYTTRTSCRSSATRTA